MEQRTGVQTLVVAVKQIDGGDCFEFAYQLGEKNGVGEKGKDNGLVVLLVTEERCIQFATGYGLEGVLPDAVCKQIQVRYMNKYLGEGNWDAGMLAGIQAINANWTEQVNLPFPEGRRNRLFTSHHPDMLFHHCAYTFMVQRTTTQEMSTVP